MNCAREQSGLIVAVANFKKEFKSEPFFVETHSTLVKLRENKKNKKDNFIALCLIKLVGESQCVFTAAVCQVQDSI